MVAVGLLAGVALGTAAVLENRAACASDNCLRAVLQTSPFATTRSQLVACSSYLAATVTPATSLVTMVEYSGSTSYVIVGNIYGTGAAPPVPGPTSTGTPVTVTPTAIPAFASTACTGNTTPAPVRFASACSCAGVTRVTTVLPSPTSTVTSTSFVVSTVTSFQIQATGASVPLSYLYDFGHPPSGDLANIISFGPVTSASSLRLDAGVLTVIKTGEESFIATTFGSSPVFLYDKNFIQSHQDTYSFIDFVVHDDLSVTAFASQNADNVLQECGHFLVISNAAGGYDVYGDSCTPVSLKLVPLP